MLNGVKKIAIVGNAASGKTSAAGMITEYFAQHVDVSVLKDRTLIEELVIAECQSQPEDANGWKTGIHSRYKIDQNGGIVMSAIDGTWWNFAHRKMFDSAAEHKDQKQLLVMEYAIAPDYRYEDHKTSLLQSGDVFCNWAEQKKASKEMFVLEILSPFELRYERDRKRRRDSMDMETFRRYFPDGGEIPPGEINRLFGDGYHAFKNTTDDDPWFQGQIYRICREVMSPALFGEGNRSMFESGRRKEI